MTTPTRLALLATVGLALVAAPACARYQAEKDGQDVGEALCDVRDASADELDAALGDLQSALAELADDNALFTAEDRADIDENLSDLAEHVAAGSEELAQQDLAVIRRSLDNIEDDLSDTGRPQSTASWAQRHD